MNAPQDPLIALVDVALGEDVGGGHWTTLWTVPEASAAHARIVAKASGTIAGTEIARLAFHRVDHTLRVEFGVADGDEVVAGTEVARIEGRSASILTAERVALNFLQHLSGIATTTRAFVDRVKGTGARILDTRKTIPGLRHLEKEAVRAGGGFNHRFGLHDMVLIKENHIRAAGGITAAVQAVGRANVRHLPVEVEATTLDEVREVLGVGVDRILLDNMPVPMLREAVGIVHDSDVPVETEASGGVTLDAVRSIAETGVDFISIGALTHSAPALDLSLLLSIDG
jgi:nicotinate-nucleotide pyrophosphorylase (carboxylating)